MEYPSFLSDIRDDLLAEKINWQVALNALSENTKRKKPWHTVEWKKNRDSLIGTNCIICGSNEILVLQHYRHPNKVSDIFEVFFDEYRKKLLSEWEAVKGSRDFTHIHKQNRECCPKCHSTAISYRKGEENWICKSTKGQGWKGGACGFIFTSPATTVGHTPKQKKEISKIKRQQWEDHCQRLRKQKEIVWKEHGKKIVLISIHESVTYYSMKYTVTCCKSCAANWDLNNIIKCPKCNAKKPIYNHSIHSEPVKCSNCSYKFFDVRD